MKRNRSTPSDAGTKAWHQHACSAVTVWFLAGLAVIFLVSCANLISGPGTTPPQTPTSSSIPPSTTPTPQLTQQYQFTEQDSERTVTYIITSRFGIILNQQTYPKENMQIFCTPPGTLGSISNLPSVAPPLYAVRYEAVQPGLCVIRNGTFLLIVRIISSG
jgi:hypothetical protein